MDLRVQPNTVQKQSVDKLREAILTGMFKPGDRLIEAQLCSMLGVSRPSVREALRRLEAEKLISSVPNRGMLIPIITWEEAREIYHVRALLEGEAAALTARNADADDIASMERALEGFAEAVTSGDALGLLKNTARFYDVILDRCGNAIIAEILRGLLARISFLRDRSMSRAGRADFSLSEMREICRAISSGDAEAARKAATAHVEKASEAARESYRESGELTEA